MHQMVRKFCGLQSWHLDSKGQIFVEPGHMQDDQSQLLARVCSHCMQAEEPERHAMCGGSGNGTRTCLARSRAFKSQPCAR
jgi:hypothetical protein